MKTILYILGNLIQFIGITGIVAAFLPYINIDLFYKTKISPWPLSIVIGGSLLSIILIYVGYLVSKYSRNYKNGKV